MNLIFNIFLLFRSQGFEEMDSFFDVLNRYHLALERFVVFVGLVKNPDSVCSGSKTTTLVLDHIANSYTRRREDSWSVVIFDSWSDENRTKKSSSTSDCSSRLENLSSDWKNALICESVSSPGDRKSVV